MPEGGEGEQRQARLVAEPARDARRLDRDFGDLLGGGHFGDRGVGDQHGAAAREHERNADQPMAGLGIDAVAHVVQRDREVARHAGHHGVGVAQRDHAGGEMIAVLIDQPLAVADR